MAALRHRTTCKLLQGILLSIIRTIVHIPAIFNIKDPHFHPMPTSLTLDQVDTATQACKVQMEELRLDLEDTKGITTQEPAWLTNMAIRRNTLEGMWETVLMEFPDPTAHHSNIQECIPPINKQVLIWRLSLLQ